MKPAPRVPCLPSVPSVLYTALLDRLVAAGTWVDRGELVDGLACSTVAADDALADLVVDGKAHWREGSGYRLVGTVLARKAAQNLLAGGHRRNVQARPVGDALHVGVAQRVEGIGLVLYELAVPMPQTNTTKYLQQMQGITNLLSRSI